MPRQEHQDTAAVHLFSRKSGTDSTQLVAPPVAPTLRVAENCPQQNPSVPAQIAGYIYGSAVREQDMRQVSQMNPGAP